MPWSPFRFLSQAITTRTSFPPSLKVTSWNRKSLAAAALPSADHDGREPAGESGATISEPDVTLSEIGARQEPGATISETGIYGMLSAVDLEAAAPNPNPSRHRNRMTLAQRYPMSCCFPANWQRVTAMNRRPKSPLRSLILSRK